jgi:MFS family permease
MTAGWTPRLRRDFRLLWGGQTISQLGSRVFGAAYVFWVLAMTGSVLQVGVLSSVMLLIFPLGQLPGGWVADRFDRRHTMMICDAASAAAALSLAAAAWAGWYSFFHMLAAVTVLGTGWAVRGRVESAALPRVVPAAELPAALGLTQGRGFATGLVGPPLAGLLFSTDHMLAFLLDGLSYLVVLTSVAAVRTPLGGATGPAASPLIQIRAGLVTFWRQPYIRTTAVLAAGLSFVISAMGLLVIAALQINGAPPSSMGVVMGGGMAGGLIGALGVKTIHRAVRSTRLRLLIAPPAAIVAVLAFSSTRTPILAALAYAGFFLFIPAWQAEVVSRTITLIPDERRGRVLASANFVSSLPVATAPLLTGLLLNAVTPRIVFLIIAALLAVITLATATSRATTHPPEPATVPPLTPAGR